MIENFYLGTYTRSKSQGVYRVKLDTEKKQLQDLSLIATLDNPTYIDLSVDKQYLFAVSKKDGLGGITVLKKTEEETYLPIQECHNQTAVPCYIHYQENHAYITTANYHESIAQSYSFKNEQLLLKHSLKRTGSGPHPNQDKSHLHYLHTSPDGNYLLACDLGTDSLITYQIDQDTLTFNPISQYQTAAGSGARHLVFHPTLPIAYLICELNAHIEILHYDASTGRFHKQGVISLFEQDSTQENWAAAIHISQDGHFLYASNRGYDCIVVFAINENSGNLDKIQICETSGSGARDFALSAQEDFLIVGHQFSDTLTLFERNPNTGLLTLLSNDFFAPECVCIKK